MLADPRVIASYLGDDHAAVARSGAAGPPIADQRRGNHRARTHQEVGHEGADSRTADRRGRGRSILRKWGPFGAIVVVLAVVGAFAAVNAGDDDSEEAGDGGSSTTAAPTSRPARGRRHLSGGRGRGNGGHDRVGRPLRHVDRVAGDRVDSRDRSASPRSPGTTVVKPTSGSRRTPSRSSCTSRRRTTRSCSSSTARSGSTTRPRTPGRPTWGYNRMLATYMETYGRRVELVRYNATGNIQDSVAATADAETIARDLKPFAVIGGPVLTESFADTLASQQGDVHQLRPAPAQRVVRRTGRLRLGHPQELRADGADGGGVHRQAPGRQRGPVRRRRRQRQAAVKFGYIYLSSSPASETNREKFTHEPQRELRRDLRRDRVVHRSRRRGDPGPGDPRPDEGEGHHDDPVQRRSARPEGAHDGGDRTGLLPRVGHHRFGTGRLDHLLPHLRPEAVGPRLRHVEPVRPCEPGGGGSGVRLRVVQRHARTGEPGRRRSLPNLSAHLQRDPVRRTERSPTIPSSRRCSTTRSWRARSCRPQVSWGDRGIFDFTDYAGIDDGTEVWWDADATGIDEINEEGTGMWAYVDGGKRYLPGEWPEGEPKLFDKSKDSITLYTDLPEGTAVPTFEPLPSVI